MHCQRSRTLGVLLVGLVLSWWAGSLPAASISWRDDIRQAAAESSQLHKPMLIKVSASWCGYCKKMERETFSQRDVIDHVARCFVPVDVDAEADKPWVRKLEIRSYPTTIIVSPQMEILARITGFRTAQQLTHDLAKVCSHDASHPDANHGMQLSVFGELCPVSPVVDGQFAKGESQYALPFHGYQLFFSSRQHQETFQRNPGPFWPVADGLCMVSALDQQSRQFGRLQYGLVYNERIWLFASVENRDRFREQPEFYVRKLAEISRQAARTRSRRR